MLALLPPTVSDSLVVFLIVLMSIPAILYWLNVIVH